MQGRPSGTKAVIFVTVSALSIFGCAPRSARSSSSPGAADRSTGSSQGDSAAPETADAKTLEALVGRCAGGDGQACLYAAVLEEREGRVKDALAHYERACELDNPAACAQYGAHHLKGEVVPQDFARAGVLFGRACQLGFADVCDVAAQLAADQNAGEHLAKTGCDAGNKTSCARLATLLVTRSGGDVDRGRKMLEDLCAGGTDKAASASACSQLGHLYEIGHGVARDMAKAIELYRKACSFADAQCVLLGDVYLRGNGVKASRSRAEELYKKACASGSADGCSALAAIDQDQSFGGIEAAPAKGKPKGK